MSRSRLALGLLLVTLASAAPADAARPKPKPKPKPFCNLVTDETGTAGIFASMAGSTTYDPSLDIVSADIANNGTTLTGVIRVKDLTEKSQMSPLGRQWGITFTNGTSSIGLTAYLSEAFGKQFSTGKGTFDFAKDEVRIHIPMAEIAYAKIRKGSTLRGFYVTTNSVVALNPKDGFGYGFAPFGGSTDDATAPKSAYPAFAASCVKVGQ